MTDSIFSLILLILVAISLVVTLLDIFWLSKRAGTDNKKTKDKTGPIAAIRSILPVLLFVLIVRSFLYAPFKIPSGSMIPTLKIGDHILVSKFAYGLRLPYFGNKIVSIAEPKRGDIIVFSSTDEFSRQNNGVTEDLIKRLVGMPGDHIRYEGKNLYINGELISKKFIITEKGSYDASLEGAYPYDVYKEALGKHSFNVINYPVVNAPSGSWTVPKGMYFMMGDNRDLSDDSRYWGFVPEKNIIGKAIVVWMHWPSWGQLPTFKYNRVLQ
ncbi:MAG: signal peptidase I [Endozoicomonadaceae bacterium]|nr:signal peptidase I [Endozoicomonadaceae bacterium]